MSHREDCDIEFDDMPDGATAVRRLSTEVGSCNFCTRHLSTDPPGIVPHVVTLVGSTRQSTSVRFCNACLATVAAIAKRIR